MTENDLEAFIANPPPLDMTRNVTLRVRLNLGMGPDTELPPSFYDDEFEAIAKGKKVWPGLCESASTYGWKVRLTMTDRQGDVCWEREAPIRLERDRTTPDDAWLLHVLRNHGPLTQPRLAAVAGLKPSAVQRRLDALEAQGLIRQGIKLDTGNPGPQPTLWDVVDGQSDQAHPAERKEE